MNLEAVERVARELGDFTLDELATMLEERPTAAGRWIRKMGNLIQTSFDPDRGIVYWWHSEHIVEGREVDCRVVARSLGRFTVRELREGMSAEGVDVTSQRARGRVDWMVVHGVCTFAEDGVWEYVRADQATPRNHFPAPPAPELHVEHIERRGRQVKQASRNGLPVKTNNKDVNNLLRWAVREHHVLIERGASRHLVVRFPNGCYVFVSSTPPTSGIKPIERDLQAAADNRPLRIAQGGSSREVPA